jgi:hypothetical protein
MRKKLRLRTDALAVESFPTLQEGTATRGTVRAHGTWDFDCYPASASQPMACLCRDGEPTADTTCNPNQCPCQPTFFPCTFVDC